MRGVKTKAGNRRKRFLIFLTLLVVLLVLLNSVSNIYKKKRDSVELLSRAEKEKMELTERRAFLNQSMERLSTDEGIEFEIRRKLNVAAVGENVAIIVKEKQDSPPESLPISLWQRLKNFLAAL